MPPHGADIEDPKHSTVPRGPNSLGSSNRALGRKIAGVALGVFIFVLLLGLSLHYAEIHHLLAAD